MPKQSAGILLYRRSPQGLEVLLVHPGGPLWAKKDDGAWSIPKGEFEEPETPLDAALREFREELGAPPPAGEPESLGTVRQPSGKVVHAWALEGDFDPRALHSNTFSLEWPPRSGRHIEVPEVDRAAWYSMSQASRKILPGQAPLLAALDRLTDGG
jgi:predicted NUDIX family NTP pyrophosphohydrolase